MGGALFVALDLFIPQGFVHRLALLHNGNVHIGTCRGFRLPPVGGKPATYFVQAASDPRPTGRPAYLFVQVHQSHTFLFQLGLLACASSTCPSIGMSDTFPLFDILQ